MSNHFSADNLKFPGDDRRLDLTDVFVFTAPHDPDTTVLIIDSNPTSAPPPTPAPVTGPEFYPGAVYRINIDTDGDAHADVAFTFVFSEYEDGRQTGTAWYATGPEARQPGPVGEVLAQGIPGQLRRHRPPRSGRPCPAVTGLRSDPFFADVEGALHGFQWTGHDDFADNNVDSIALEVPRGMFGGPVIGVWASISRRRSDGTLEQLDRGGNPTINPVINPDGEKDLFNSRQPPMTWQLPAAVDGDPAERGRLLTRSGQGGRAAGTAGYPALRPHPARRLSQRPRPHRRRVQRALCLAEQRQYPPERPEAARRPAGPLPPSRPAPPLTDVTVGIRVMAECVARPRGCHSGPLTVQVDHPAKPALTRQLATFWRRARVRHHP